MSMLVFQDSRRQLLTTLDDRLATANESGSPDEAEKRRIISLSQAIEAADK
jgi:hypothetical protein